MTKLIIVEVHVIVVRCRVDSIERKRAKTKSRIYRGAARRVELVGQIVFNIMVRLEFQEFDIFRVRRQTMRSIKESPNIGSGAIIKLRKRECDRQEFHE